MEVAIGNEITKTITVIRKDKVRYFELLELMNKFAFYSAWDQILSKNVEKQKM